MKRAPSANRRATVSDRRPAPAQPGERWQIAMAMVLVIAAPLLVFWPVCTHDFLTYDDNDQIAANPTMNPVTVRSVEEWWTTPHLDMYAPLTYSIWGMIASSDYDPSAKSGQLHLDAEPFHSANLVGHLLAGLAVFALLRLLIGGVWPAAMGALLFALHPVQVEAVAWMSEFNTVLSTLLALVSIWLYLLAVRSLAGSRGGRAGHWLYASATVVFVLAMLAKPAAMVTPFIAALLECMIIGRPWRQSARSLWPWLVLAIGCGLETVIFQSGGGMRSNVAWYLRPIVAVDSVAFYLGKIFWPAHLLVDYGRRPRLMLQEHGLVLKCAIVVAAAIVLAWIGISPRWPGRSDASATVAPVGGRRNKGDEQKTSPPFLRILPAGAAVFLLPLLPVLGLVTFDFQWFSNVTDHYLYLPMFGVAIIAAGICQRWRRVPVYAAAAAVIAGLGFAASTQASLWQNTWTIFTYNRQYNPTSAVALNQFTRVALDDGELSLALACAQQEIARHPDDQYPYRVAGMVLARRHQWAEAEGQFQAALRQAPDDPLTLQDLAGVQMAQRRYAEAEEHAKRAVALAPDSSDAHFNLALILKNTGHLTEALAEAEKAEQLDPASLRNRQLADRLRAMMGMEGNP